MSGRKAKATSALQVGYAETHERTARAYCRCNSGHYFQGECCPFDGWSSTASRELAGTVESLAAKKQELSLAVLRKLGVSRATLERTIVVEFGCEASAFEAVSPRELVVNGEAMPLVKLGPSFK
jgi:hypothetical protein